jgi:7,8-dihydropterin-6-yl-methyl-4-(beta-D-ribofuranosyl)aminobenzene 5'-phosphate synthase
VRGRGTTVLSACSHAGVVNASLGAQALWREPIDVVLGGYHLSGKAMEARIAATVRDLSARIRPRVVAPGHCTGWRAKAALAQAFAPERYGPSAVGAMYTLRASSSGTHADAGPIEQPHDEPPREHVRDRVGERRVDR